MDSEGSNSSDTTKILILAIYSAGIIVGGGILALPFVALDSGWIFLMASLVVLAIIFSIVYTRILESISVSRVNKKSLGLISYDLALENSGLTKWGKIAFTLGIILYVYPADIVYVLYGMKSIIQLSEYVEKGYLSQNILLAFLISVIVLSLLVLKTYSSNPSPLKSMVAKLLVMSAIWLTSITIISHFTYEPIVIIFSSLTFVLSLLIGEYFPERLPFKNLNERNNVAEYEIHPRHRAQASLTVFKLTLILVVPIAAFILIIASAGLPEPPPFFPTNLVSLVDSFSVIVFMYVGSGVYNILMYKWIANKLERGKKIAVIGVLISLIVYIVFTAIILLSVDRSILEISDLNREHSFISLSRKLEAIGLSSLALTVIGLAATFALVSVAVAYIGFTDTLSERLELDTKINRDKLWFLITIIVFLSATLLELFNVTRIATDALGVAGNAGGGLFLLFLPWLMVTKKDQGKIKIALIFLALITIVNVFMFLGGTTIIAKIAALISTLLVIILGFLTIKEKNLITFFKRL